MADALQWNSYVDQPNQPDRAIPDDSAPAWSDYGKAAETGATSALSGVQSGVSVLQDALGNHDAGTINALRAQLNRGTTEDIEQSMTPAGQQALEGPLSDHPVRGTVMRVLQMAPAIAAASIPGGLVADMLGGAAGAGAAAAMNAGLTASQFADEVANRVDNTPDDELAQKWPLFEQMAKTTDPQTARDALRDDLVNGDGRLVLTALGGALGGGFGIAGRIAGGGIGKGIAAGAAEAGVANAAMGSTSDYATQQADIKGGYKPDMDMGEFARQTFEALGLGAVMGAAHGAFHGVSSPRDYRKPDTVSQKSSIQPEQMGEGAAPDPTQAAAVKSEVTDHTPPTAPQDTQMPAGTPSPEGGNQVASTPESQPAGSPAAPAPTPESNLPGPEIPPATPTPATDNAVPEAPNTLQLQQQAMMQGKRDVMVFKAGENALPVPPGFKQTKVGPDLYQYNPGKYTAGQIQTMVRKNTIGEALGLGPITKDAAVQGVQAGQAPVAVTERAPDGTELKAAAGTDQTAPVQVASLEAQKSPDSTVQVENPQNVVAQRVAAQPVEHEPLQPSEPEPVPGALAQTFAPAEVAGRRVMPDLTPEARANADLATAMVGKNVASMEPAAEGTGAKRSKAQVADRSSINDAATKAVMANPPPEGGETRQAAQARAKAMLDAFKQSGQKLPDAIKDGTNETQQFNEHVALLRQAKDFVTRKSQSDYNRFVANDIIARGEGGRDLITQDSRIGGDIAKGVGLGEGEENIPAEQPDETENEPETQEAAPPTRTEAPITPDSNSPAAQGFGSRAGKFQNATPKSRRVVRALGDQLEQVPYTAADHFHMEPTRSTTLGEELARLYPGQGVASQLARRVAQLAGDTPVHYVSKEAVDRITPNAAGHYDPNWRHIAIDEGQTSYAENHLLLHEGLHAALEQGIGTTPGVREGLQNLMSEFADQHPDLINEYAFTNEHEFVSEILSNPELRAIASATPISGKLAAQLGVPSWVKGSIWQGIVGAMRKVLGLSQSQHTILEGVMSQADRAGLGDTDSAKAVQGNVGLLNTVRPMMATAELRPEGASERERLLSGVSDQVANVKSWTDEQSRKWAPKFMTNSHIQQVHDALFGPRDESNPMRRFVDGVERAGVRMRKLLQPADEMGRELSLAQKSHEGEDWEKFAGLLNDSTMAGVHADVGLDHELNNHLRLGKNATEEDGNMKNWWARAQHAELSETFNALPKDLQQLYRRVVDYYTGEREARVRQNLSNVLDALPAPEGSTRAEVADRIYNRSMTDEDEAHYAAQGYPKGTFREAEALQKAQGPYVPLKRRGQYVVTGEHAVEKPTGKYAQAVDKDGAAIPNAFDFDTREAAHDYAANSKLRPEVKAVYFDPATGKLSTKEGSISTAGSGVQKFRVEVQNQHMEMAETKAEAEARRGAMTDAGLKNVSPVQLAEKHAGMDFGLKSGQVNLLKKAVERIPGMSAADKDRMMESFERSSVTLQRGNRLESTFLKRKNVAGASTEVIRNLADYAHASSAFRARAEFKPDIDGAMNDMRKVIADGVTKGSPDTLERQRWVQELESRLEGFGSPEYSGPMAPVWQKLMALSFLKRMLSPAHLALHLTHPMMVSGPEMGGRYGLNNSYRELFRAYNDLGGRGALGEGVKGMARNFREDGSPTNFGNYFREQIASAPDRDALTRMFGELESTGHIHSDAGFDVGRYTENQSSFDRGLGRVDRAFRELTSATETVNRYATAVAEYRLAKKSGMSDDEATRSTKDVLANTQGLYSRTNAAPIFRGAARPFLQFKQMPATLITLMGRLIYRSFKGETPEVRQQALKSFASMMGAATLMSGVGGLPQEAGEAVNGLGKLLGVSPDWLPTEDNMRLGLSKELGPELSKLVMGGITGLGPTGVNVGHRMGYASLLTFGEPASTRESDVEAWIADTVFGAPGSYLADTYDGLSKLRNGDYTGAVEKLAPAKAMGDIAKAAQDYTQGKPNIGMKPLGAPEALMQAFGFQPREVQDYEDAHYNAQAAIRSQATPRVGPKGQKILGISAGRKSTPTLNNYSQAYGVQ